MKKVILYLVSFLAIQCLASFAVAVVYLFYLLFSGNIDDVIKDGLKLPPTMLVVTSAIYSLATLVLFLRKKWCEPAAFYLQKRYGRVLLWGALLVIGALVPTSLFEEWLNLDDIAGETIRQIISSDFGFLTLCIFAPVVEEVVFRGAILAILLKLLPKRWWAILLSALLFSLVHMNPAQMPYAFAAGIFLGWIYERTGSILPGIVAHWVNNSIVFAICKYLPWLATGGMTQYFATDKRTLGLSIIFSLFIFIPSLYQLNRLTKR